jgi:hypothetical protein
VTGNGNNNEGQRARQPGGCTGRGFLPGQSGNPKGGRPKVKGLMTALKAKLAEKSDDGRTYEERLVAVLMDEALKGRNRVAAVIAIFDRCLGKPAQQLNLNDITRLLQGRSEEELMYYAEHGCFPEDANEKP